MWVAQHGDGVPALVAAHRGKDSNKSIMIVFFLSGCESGPRDRHKR
ncbi:MAG: hypothetical protein QOI83_3105, partial [Streptomycetaceae bacterium]|nr:hypothetical protein [Streptomycetaceae bacterium]